MSKIKVAILCNSKHNINRVYIDRCQKEIEQQGEIVFVGTYAECLKNLDAVKQVEVIFSTWGMPVVKKQDIKVNFPALKVVLYGAGTVQSFARPFLESGIKVCSAWRANGIPVAEFTFAQIALASKGYFRGAKAYKVNALASLVFKTKSPCNYKTTIGIVGLGAIGAMVAEKLKSLDVRVLACDPFVSEERAKSLGVTIVDMPTLFAESDVISNHLANKKELTHVYNYKLFKLMKPYATFINTGRGKQINEWQLAWYLLTHPSRTALLDVLTTDVSYLSPLWLVRNAICSPHMAGSTGGEVVRMADYMIEEFKKYANGESLQHEVSIEMLATMA